MLWFKKNCHNRYAFTYLQITDLYIIIFDRWDQALIHFDPFQIA